MTVKHLLKFAEILGVTFLGGSALYLAFKNEELEKRNEFLKKKVNNDKFYELLLKIYKKYSLIGDKLKEHIEEMQDITNKKFKGWSEDESIITEFFPEKDIQFLGIDILVIKILGLIDAFILNRWSSLDEKFKKISKNKINNGKNLDIMNLNDIRLVLDRLEAANEINVTERVFMEKINEEYKIKILVDRIYPEKYLSSHIESIFNFTVNMISQRA